MIISFTGHRTIGESKIPNPEYKRVCQETERLLKEINPSLCLSGMAIGYDQYAANICRILKIPYEAIIPFKNQEKLWSEEDKKRYNFLLKYAKEEKVLYESYAGNWQYQKRNEYLVHNCDVLIAAFNGKPSGTKNCIDYANKIGRKVIIIGI